MSWRLRDTEQRWLGLRAVSLATEQHRCPLYLPSTGPCRLPWGMGLWPVVCSEKRSSQCHMKACELTPLQVAPAPCVCQCRRMALARTSSLLCNSQLQSSPQGQAVCPVQEGSSWCCGIWCFPFHLHLVVFPSLNLCDDD